MKTRNLMLSAAVAALALTACKSDEEKQAEKTVDTYTTYIDSVSNVAEADAKANWQAIDAEYNQRTTDAEAALANMKDKEKAQERINASKAKYEQMKAKYQAQLDQEKAAADAANNGGSKAQLRSSLFPMGQIGDDMNMDWVNKDNILKVYNDFNNAYDHNHGDYTREDFDEVKLLYEALDARKNTVEKEGLSSEDNRKIAELKFKFGPKFKLDRIAAKSAENEHAKDKAE
ncbi:MAG: hypothetical protein EOO51_02215 [Flavobacterium sp.]|nr:MAG: hypothetical protein EOO51_02215 [Flavobacterium sp.]